MQALKNIRIEGGCLLAVVTIFIGFVAGYRVASVEKSPAMPAAQFEYPIELAFPGKNTVEVTVGKCWIVVNVQKKTHYLSCADEKGTYHETK